MLLFGLQPAANFLFKKPSFEENKAVSTASRYAGHGLAVGHMHCNTDGIDFCTALTHSEL